MDVTEKGSRVDLFKNNLDHLKKLLIPFILLFAIPIAGWISHKSIDYIVYEMEKNWLQDLSYSFYSFSLFLSPLIVITQMIFFIKLLLASIKAKRTNFILLSAVLILVNCSLGFLSFGRIAMAVAGV
jgi:hypothetical protein